MGIAASSPGSLSPILILPTSGSFPVFVRQRPLLAQVPGDSGVLCCGGFVERGPVLQFHHYCSLRSTCLLGWSFCE